MRTRRLRDRIVWNIHHLVRGEGFDAYGVKPEYFRMEEPFGSSYGRLARIHDLLKLLHTKLTELDDATSNARIMNEASRWVIGKSREDEEQMLSQVQHALESLESEASETESAGMTGTKASGAIRHLRIHLGKNNLKASKGIKLYKFGGAVDLLGPRAEHFQDLLSTEDRQFSVARMLAEIDSQNVRNAYRAFAEEFADLFTQGTWSSKDCDAYEEGLVKQERLVSEALKRERQRKASIKPPKSHQWPQTTEKPSRSSLPPFFARNQSIEQEARTRRRRTESANILQAPPTHTKNADKQPQASPNVGNQCKDMGGAAHERIQGLAVSNTTFLRSHSRPDDRAQLTIRLDPAGARNKAMSRHLTWSPNDTRSAFLDKVAELFPGKVIQQVNARLPQGTQIIIKATGPGGEWDMVREEWLKRLKQPLKKESSAAVYLVETAIMSFS